MPLALALFANPQLTAWEKLLVLGLLVALFVVVWLLGKLFPRKYYAGIGNALMAVQQIYRPSTEHVIEARQDQHQEDEESGDPPDPAAH